MTSSSTSHKRITYKGFAGISIKGKTQWLPASVNNKNHLDKATWLTSAVEVGSVFGTVQSYDGAGISAGIEHQIAVLPKTMQQGGLWGFLNKLEDALEPNMPRTLVALFGRFDQVGWYLDPRGILRNKHTGSAVSGTEIRNEIAPVNGVVPESGPDYDKAVLWAKLFANAFGDPATFATQIKQAKLGLLHLHKKTESLVYSRYCNIADASVAVVGTNISEDLDLAMCIYHSYSVNAPTRARQLLEHILSKNLSEKSFCYELIKAFGTSDFANWKQRYVRTWTAAKNSGLFKDSLFSVAGPAPATF